MCSYLQFELYGFALCSMAFYADHVFLFGHALCIGCCKYIRREIMVLTRAGTVRRHWVKVRRLLQRLSQIGVVKGSLTDVNIVFYSPKPEHLTQRSVWTVYCNPVQVTFSWKVNGKEKIVALGCLHDLCVRCQTCDVHPDADVKDHKNFLMLRARAMNVL